jgi:hypothetical protein
MDTAQTSLRYLAAMEAPENQGKRLEEKRAWRKPRLGIGNKWKRPVVELRGFPHESGASQKVL